MRMSKTESTLFAFFAVATLALVWYGLGTVR